MASKKEEMKKNKSISISHELYLEVSRNALAFFRQKEEREGVEAVKINQNALTDYLLAINFENDSLNTEA